MKKIKKRPVPTAEDFARMMEALAASNLDDSEAGKVWGRVYRLAHTCFVKATTGETACPHPDWEKEFWKTYDGVKSYWEN